MEIIFRRKDIIDIIKQYYKRIEGMDVSVIEYPKNNIDETFKVQYNFNDENGKTLEYFIPANKLSELVKASLSSFGFNILEIEINYGGKHENVIENSVKTQKYVPYIQKITVNCELPKLEEKSIKM